MEVPWQAHRAPLAGEPVHTPYLTAPRGTRSLRAGASGMRLFPRGAPGPPRRTWVPFTLQPCLVLLSSGEVSNLTPEFYKRLSLVLKLTKTAFSRILQHFYISHVFHNEHELHLEAVETREKFTRRFYTWIVLGSEHIKSHPEPCSPPSRPSLQSARGAWYTS